MPILGPEPDQFPDDLLSQSSTDSMAEWVVAHTLPRREKDLMRRLHSGEVAYYGPLIARRFRSPSGRKRVSYVPLFPGYVFARVNEEQRQFVYETKTVCQVLPVGNADQLLADLRNIRRLIATNAALTPEAKLQSGDRVRIRSGPMQGLEGTVIRRRGQERLLVAVEFLQVGASVQLEDCELEQIV